MFDTSSEQDFGRGFHTLGANRSVTIQEGGLQSVRLIRGRVEGDSKRRAILLNVVSVVFKVML